MTKPTSLRPSQNPSYRFKTVGPETPSRGGHNTQGDLEPFRVKVTNDEPVSRRAFDFMEASRARFRFEAAQLRHQLAQAEREIERLDEARAAQQIVDTEAHLAAWAARRGFTLERPNSYAEVQLIDGKRRVAGRVSTYLLALAPWSDVRKALERPDAILPEAEREKTPDHAAERFARVLYELGEALGIDENALAAVTAEGMGDLLVGAVKGLQERVKHAQGILPGKRALASVPEHAIDCDMGEDCGCPAGDVATLEDLREVQRQIERAPILPMPDHLVEPGTIAERIVRRAAVDGVVDLEGARLEDVFDAVQRLTRVVDGED